MQWTEKQIATAERMWRSGYTAYDIAREIGFVSRSAVLGKLHRMGLLGKTNQPRQIRTKNQPRKSLTKVNGKPKSLKPVPKVANPLGNMNRPKKEPSEITGRPKEFYYLMRGEYEYVHMSGFGFTKKEHEVWTGTKLQSENLIAKNKEYQSVNLTLVYRGKAIKKNPFYRNGG